MCLRGVGHEYSPTPSGRNSGRRAPATHRINPNVADPVEDGRTNRKQLLSKRLKWMGRVVGTYKSERHGVQVRM